MTFEIAGQPGEGLRGVRCAARPPSDQCDGTSSGRCRAGRARADRAADRRRAWPARVCLHRAWSSTPCAPHRITPIGLVSPAFWTADAWASGNAGHSVTCSIDLSVQAGGQPGCCRLMLPWLSEADITSLRGPWTNTSKRHGRASTRLASDRTDAQRRSTRSSPATCWWLAAMILNPRRGGFRLSQRPAGRSVRQRVASDTPLATSAILAQASPTPLSSVGDAVTVRAQFPAGA